MIFIFWILTVLIRDWIFLLMSLDVFTSSGDYNGYMANG